MAPATTSTDEATIRSVIRARFLSRKYPMAATISGLICVIGVTITTRDTRRPAW
jgi:hypothetical protein